jgi:hypothetical protein
MNKSATAGCFALTLLATSVCFTPLQAEESGRWRGLAVLVTTDSKTAEIADQEGHSIFLGHDDGVVFNDDGGSFLDKARYEVVFVADTAGMVDGGYKTFTAADGSQVFARFRSTNAAPPEFEGTWEFIGGTGAYQGITGSGEYVYTSVADGVGWDILEGEYKIP